VITTAQVKPKGLKRDVTEKKWCQALGFKDAVGLSDTVGNIELSSCGPHDSAFLVYLFDVFADGGSIETFDNDGKKTSKYTQEKRDRYSLGED